MPPVVNSLRIMEAIESVIELAGYHADDRHFKDTAERWYRAIMEFAKADPKDVESILRVGFDEEYSGMVLIKGVAYTSLCPHHLLPYSGLASVAYLPDGNRVAGISKLARLVEHHTHQIVVQEAATKSIVDDIETFLKPKGVIAVLTATHSCMSTRGIRAVGSTTTTSDLRGAFRENAHGCRNEFYSLVGTAKAYHD